MDWRGVEWVIPLYELAMLVVPIYGFVALRRRVKRRTLAKLRAFSYYTGLVAAPIALYILFFFSLVAIDNVTQVGVISEGLARTLFLMVGFGLLIWLVSSILFGIVLAFTRNSALSP